MDEPTVDDLLDRADAERAAGRGPAAARLYAQSVAAHRGAGDLAGWTRGALGLASVYLFGTDPGDVPAQLYDVYVRTVDDVDRARLAAALARCWAYGGQVGRAVRFADDAVAHAQRTGRAELISDCLDAALAAHWGPAELQTRIELAAQLDEAAAHVLDPDVRLQAQLWGLQIACEVLDMQSVHRHMRALEKLGEQSPRALFFAATRRFMLDLLRGRTDTGAQLMSTAAVAAEQAGLADAWMVLAGLPGYAAVQTGDRQACAATAQEAEEFGIAEGIPVVCAEAAYLWLHAGEPERSAAVARTISLDELTPDVHWLMTVQCVLDCALGTGEQELAQTAARLLAPFAGRAVFDSGAVMFHGVTDDTLARAAAMRGDHDEAQRLSAQALATYQRVGASWWRERLASSVATWAPAAPSHRVHLHPTADGLWLIGPGASAVPVRALRGYGYLRELLRRPGATVAALDLVGAAGGTVDQPGLGDVLDAQAREAYRRRLLDIDRDLEQAQDWSDLHRVDALQAERDALIAELASAVGLGGRVRQTGASAERARVAVTKAISAAIERVTSVDRPLAEHLRRSVRTGTRCSYNPGPDDGTQWVLD